VYAIRGVALASGELCGIYKHTTNLMENNALGLSMALVLRLKDCLFLPLSGRGVGGGGGMGIVMDLY
jgi:hypothetical protein